MEFGKFYNIWLLIFVIGLGFLFYSVFRWKQNVRKNFADQHLLKQLIPNLSNTKSGIRNGLIIVVLCLLVFSLMDPLFGSSSQTVKREGADIVFALDVSTSMDTEDIAPSRLEKAKKIIQETIQNFGGDRVGLVIFAGKAYTVSPLTSDYNAIESYLESVTTDLFHLQGTNTSDAIKESVDLLNDTKNHSKVVVLISDGENHEPELDESIDLAKENGVQIISLGIGTEKGAPIPIKEFGEVVDYKKDRYGETVISKLSESNLKKIGKQTKAKYIKVGGTNESVNQLTNELSNLEKISYGETVTEQKNHIFQWFLFVAIALLFIDSLTSGRKLFR